MHYDENVRVQELILKEQKKKNKHTFYIQKNLPTTIRFSAETL